MIITKCGPVLAMVPYRPPVVGRQWNIYIYAHVAFIYGYVYTYDVWRAFVHKYHLLQLQVLH